MLVTIYAVLVLIYWTFLTVYLLVNGRKILYLSSVEKTGSASTPAVAVIIAVRNEEYALEQALLSVCNLNYNNYQVIVINDRSTDNTGRILSEMQEKYDTLRVINIEKLPSGWLGKNHALYTGYRSSDQEYMLFTDADVLFHPDVLTKAMNYCVKHDLDHLTILPGITSRSLRLNSIILTFIIMLTALQRPWAAKLKTSKASIGVGAFNLVKRKAYERAGTHEVLAMRPDDDLKLAAYMKAAGGAADVLYGMKDLQLEWYANVKEFISGLMKNVFSGFDYNVIKAAGGITGTLLFFVLPLPLILIFGTSSVKICAIGIFLVQAILFGNTPGSRGKWWYAFLSIYAGIIITYVMFKATVITLYNGGIYWRGTFYSLKQLRKYK